MHLFGCSLKFWWVVWAAGPSAASSSAASAASSSVAASAATVRPAGGLPWVEPVVTPLTTVESVDAGGVVMLLLHLGVGGSDVLNLIPGAPLEKAFVSANVDSSRRYIGDRAPDCCRRRRYSWRGEPSGGQWSNGNAIPEREDRSLYPVCFRTELSQCRLLSGTQCRQLRADVL